MSSTSVHRGSGSSTTTVIFPAPPPAESRSEHQVLTFPSGPSSAQPHSELEVFASSSGSSSRLVTSYESMADVDFEYRKALAALNGLAAIILKHRGMRDELSNDLRSQGKDLTLKGFELLGAASLTKSRIPRSDDLLSRLVKLKRVLCFGQNMLQKPSILFKGSEEERAAGMGLVAEAAALETYCNAFNFVAQELPQELGISYRYTFERDVSPHPFAQDMCQWIRDLGIPELEEQKKLPACGWTVMPPFVTENPLLKVPMISLMEVETPVTARTDVIPIEEMNIGIACAVCSKFNKIISDTGFRLSIRKKSEGVREEMAQTEQRVAKSIADFDASVKKNTEDLTARWDKTQATHAATVKGCQETIQQFATELGAEKKETAELKVTVQGQATTINGLNGQVQYWIGRAQSAENAVNNMDSGCTIL